MMTIARPIGVAAVLTGVALATAGQAAAEPLSGQYNRFMPGMQSTVTFVPCGPDCTTLQTSGGLSSGPKTKAGKRRIAFAQKQRWKAYRERKALLTFEWVRLHAG